MREKLSTFTEILGLFVAAYGVALLNRSAGFIAAGAALVLVGFSEGRK